MQKGPGTYYLNKILPQLDGYAQMYASQKPQVVRFDWADEPALPAGSAAGRPYVAPGATNPTASPTTQAAAAPQKYLDTLISGARSARAPGGAKLKVVETGWIYK